MDRNREKRQYPARAPAVRAEAVDRAIVQILEGSDVPLGAHALASAVRDRGVGVPVVSVYRALDRLLQRAAVQKVEALSCYRIRDKNDAVLLICVRCGTTTSVAMPSEYARIVDRLPAEAFALSSLSIEARGVCEMCGKSGR